MEIPRNPDFHVTISEFFKDETQFKLFFFKLKETRTKTLHHGAKCYLGQTTYAYETWTWALRLLRLKFCSPDLYTGN